LLSFTYIVKFHYTWLDIFTVNIRVEKLHEKLVE